MQTVYEAKDGLEAHMIAGVLKQERIESFIIGEHLQGGIGEVQASGFVRVQVHNDDADQAREIITQWESSAPQPMTDSNSMSAPAHPSSIQGYINGILIYMFGLITGVVIMSFIL